MEGFILEIHRQRDLENYGDEFLFVSPSDLGSEKYILNTEKKLSKKGFSISRKFPQGSVLFTCIGSTIGKSGVAAIELTSNQQINAIVVDEKYSNEFLYYALEKDADKIKLLAGEQAVPILNKSQFESIRIICPPLPEQKAIAHILSLMDTAITKNNLLIAKKELQKKWFVQNLLTGKKRLKGFEKEKWKEVRLGDVAVFLNGKAYSQDELFSNGKYKILRVGNFFTNSNWYYSDLELEEDKYVFDGDLMYAWSASFGPRFWVGEKTIYHYHIWKVVPFKLIIKQFLFFFLAFDTEKIFNNKQGGTMFHITKGDMEKRKINLPSLPEQTAIAKVLQAADKEIQLLKTKTEKLRGKKKGLMQVLLTGKKRLKIV